MLVVGAVALIVIALIAFAAMSLGRSGGCNAALPTQRFECLGSLAVQTGNAQICGQIGNSAMEGTCIVSVAQSTDNALACDILPVGESRVFCVENVSYSASNPSLCSYLDPDNNSLCRYGIADKLNFSSASYCSGIPNSSYATLCSSQSYFHLALATGNYSYCGKLTDSANGTIVYAMEQQGGSYQSADAYGQLYGFINATPRDLCYSALGTQGSQAACGYISNSTLRAACGTGSASLNYSVPVANLTAACAKANDTRLVSLCDFGVYTNQAVKSSNESWCGQLTNQSYMMSCVVNLATTELNATYCNALQNASNRQSCVYETQLAAGNYS